jgi:hypothetical protein
MMNMKTKLLGLLMLSLTILTACDKNDDNTSSTMDVRTVATSGNWRVTYFMEENREQTSIFSGYSFTFAANNSLTAIKGTSSIAGSWATDTDDSKSKLVIVFAGPSGFDELTEDWLVIESTSSRIKLQHTSGGNGTVDYLTFEKN